MNGARIGIVLLSLATVWGQSRASEPLKLETTISMSDVQGRIDHLSVDLNNQRLFVAALGNNSVEVLDIKAEGCNVLGELLGALLESHEHARLAELERPAHQELHRKQRFPAAGGAADQAWPPAGKTSARDIVEPGDASWGFRERSGCGGFFGLGG